MFYLASGYEERVGEVFESRETRLNAWKCARVQRMHVRARIGAREHAGRASARACARLADVCASARLYSGTVHLRARSSPEMKKST
ncbi:hypothetical protein CRG98_044836 [Punica granatum]|uniref:Uncharacterized protein n=1 Tax=Punica granatum TaxID=22663 RepID=A0A2I0HSS2_PUNGR|nr:hypothetical protein CRG98_044836 [Punica granatum]